MLTKGNRFHVESPLSVEARDFLLGFSDSCEEITLARHSMNEDQVAIALAQRRNGQDNRAGRLRNAARRRLQSEWAQEFGNGLQRLTGAKVRWWTLVGARSPKGTYGQQPPLGWPYMPPAWDHGEIWGRDKVPFVAISQPYPGLLADELDGFDAFGEQFGLRYRISNFPSWYFPRRCWFVEWFADYETV